jgi:MFS family permease
VPTPTPDVPVAPVRSQPLLAEPSPAATRWSRLRTTLVARNPDFRRLWVGQTISLFGDQMTAVALPTIAIILLHATPLEIGLLTMTGFLGYPVFGLLAGVWADRLPRRRVLLASDVASLAALASIPLAAAAGVLQLPQLYVVGAIVGSAAVFFDVAYQAYVPSIVDRDDLPLANARLELSNSITLVSGPALSGVLIQAVGAANAIVADTLSYVASIGSLLLIRRPEHTPARRRASLFPQVREGLHVVFSHSLLRRLTITTTIANLGRGMALELFLLYAYRALGWSPGVAGALLAVGSIGSLIGAVVTARLTRRLGLGRTLVVSSITKGLPWTLAPLALVFAPAPLMALVIGVSSFFIPVWNVNNLSLRQFLTEPHLQGRVAATVRTLAWVALPVAGLLGGVFAQIGTTLFGQRIGLAIVLVFGGLLWSSATLALPIRRIVTLQTAADATSGYAPRRT